MKSNSFRSFLEELKTPKGYFEINRPLSGQQHQNIFHNRGSEEGSCNIVSLARYLKIVLAKIRGFPILLAKLKNLEICGEKRKIL